MRKEEKKKAKFTRLSFCKPSQLVVVLNCKKHFPSSQFLIFFLNQFGIESVLVMCVYRKYFVATDWI